MKMPEIISSDSLFSLGPQLAARAVAAPTSVAWGLGSRAMYIPFTVTESITVVKLWALNGATVSGNIDMGVYNTAAVLQIAATEATQTGINALQEFNVPDTVLAAGIYYLGIVLDNTTGTFLMYAAPTTASMKSLGLYLQAAAYPLPSPATFATATAAAIPVCGMSTRVTI